MRVIGEVVLPSQIEFSSILREFRSHTNQRKGHLLLNPLKSMINNFEETGFLAVERGRGRIRKSEQTITYVENTFIKCIQDHFW